MVMLSLVPPPPALPRVCAAWLLLMVMMPMATATAHPMARQHITLLQDGLQVVYLEGMKL